MFVSGQCQYLESRAANDRYMIQIFFHDMFGQFSLFFPLLLIKESLSKLLFGHTIVGLIVVVVIA